MIQSKGTFKVLYLFMDENFKSHKIMQWDIQHAMTKASSICIAKKSHKHHVLHMCCSCQLAVVSHSISGLPRHCLKSSEYSHEYLCCGLQRFLAYARQLKLPELISFMENLIIKCLSFIKDLIVKGLIFMRNWLTTAAAFVYNVVVSASNCCSCPSLC